MEVRILYKPVGKPWQEASIANTLKAMQISVMVNKWKDEQDG